MSQTPWWKGTHGEWYVVIQFVLFALVALGPRAWPGWPSWVAPFSWLGWITGVLVGGLGGLLVLSGVFGLGSSLTAVPYPKDDATLVMTGPYRFVRHPIYAGLILAALGWALLRNGWLTLVYALILFIFFDIKSRREEQWLGQKYPDYAAYRQCVHKLIPFIY